VVALAGDVDPQAIVRIVEVAFGAMPRGQVPTVAAPAWQGGLRTRALAGCAQTHAVLGFALPSLAGAHQPGVVAAALLGEGMSSPLMDELRERRGLVYYAACSADVLELAGQFVIEASTSPAQLDDFFAEVQLLLAQAEAVDGAALERAHRQIEVRELRALERPARRLESAALELFALGRVRPRAEAMAALAEVTADQVRDTFAGMLHSGAAVAVSGRVKRGLEAPLRDRIAPLLRR
jgi:predicted Zn-dependent peptidase